jgi:hypothetical protein
MMKRMLLPALGLLLCTNAYATDYNNTTLTMYQADGSPSSPPPDKYQFDGKMIIYEPDSGPAPKNQLIIFLHGHPSGPTGGDFLENAASLGFHGISLDYDYGSDPDGVNNGPRYVCGCFSQCYSQFHNMILAGNNHAGIPTSRYPVKDRIKSVLTYLNQIRPNGHWGQYLNGNNIVWSQIVLAGHSRGTSLITHLAKYNQVARVVSFSGDHDQIINGTPAQTYGDGQAGSPSTSYNYGTSNGIGSCTYPGGPGNFSPLYLQDNSWTGTAPNDTPWATQRARCGPSQTGGCMYWFSNEADTVAPYLESYIDPHSLMVYFWGTAMNLATLGVDNVAGGHALTGNWTSGENSGWETNSPDWLTSGVTTLLGAVLNPGDLCGVGDPHDNPIRGSCVTQAATALQKKVWNYMLTNPN